MAETIDILGHNIDIDNKRIGEIPTHGYGSMFAFKTQVAPAHGLAEENSVLRPSASTAGQRWRSTVTNLTQGIGQGKHWH
jgi:hypothetical protein